MRRVSTKRRDAQPDGEDRRRTACTGAASRRDIGRSAAMAGLRDARACGGLPALRRTVLHAPRYRNSVARLARAQRRYPAWLCRSALARTGRLLRAGGIYLGAHVCSCHPVVLAGDAHRHGGGRRRLVRPGRGRNPRPRRLLRPDHFWRSRNSLQDRAQHPRNRRLGRNPGHSGSDNHAVSRRRARSA